MNDIETVKLLRRIEKLRELPQIQYDSTTPMDEYFTGMYNGLECAVALLEEREPKYLSVETKPKGGG